MGIRFTTFCKRSVAAVTSEQLLNAVKAADLSTLAEGYDLDDDVIEPALKQLRIENMDRTGFRFWRLYYRPEGLRQIDIERWQTPEEVRDAIGERLETLEYAGHPKLKRIRAYLEEVVDTVDVSFGNMDGERMAVVLASEVARWFAQEFGGIVKDCDDKWWRLGEYKEFRRL